MIIGFYLMLLLMQNLPFRNVELGAISIDGFYIGQEIPDRDDINNNGRYVMTGEDDTSLYYEVAESNRIQLHVSKDDNKVTMVAAYHDEEMVNNNMTSPSLLAPSIEASPIDNISVDAATFNDVVAVFGDKYNKLLFSDAYEQVIYYRDRQNKVEVQFCFNNDILVTMVLRKH
jgi:hypothetical protein